MTILEGGDAPATLAAPPQPPPSHLTAEHAAEISRFLVTAALPKFRPTGEPAVDERNFRRT